MPATEDKLARIIGVLSLVVSTAAVLVPYFQQRAVQQEHFIAELESKGIGSYRLTKINLGENGQVVQSPWRVVLSNTGSLKLSVVAYSLSSGLGPGEKRYSGLDGGLTDEQGNPVTLPIVLDGGETKTVVLSVGALAATKAIEILRRSAVEKSIPIEQGNLILARSGIDIFGNSVTLKEFEGGHLIEWNKPQKPVYWIEITTGRGNVFRTSASP